jgi:hypothetical protein
MRPCTLATGSTVVCRLTAMRHFMMQVSARVRQNFACRLNVPFVEYFRHANLRTLPIGCLIKRVRLKWENELSRSTQQFKSNYIRICCASPTIYSEISDR